MKRFKIKKIIKDKSYKNYHISGDLLYKFQDYKNLLVIPRTLELDDSRERTYGGKPKSAFGRSILYAI